VAWDLIGGGWGVSKAKIRKRMYEATLEFPEGWGGGFKVKNHPWGTKVMDIFWNHALHFFMPK